jgi:hypothetical protein
MVNAHYKWLLLVMAAGFFHAGPSVAAGPLGLPGGGLELPGNVLPNVLERTTGPVNTTLDRTLGTATGVLRDAVGRPRRADLFDRDLLGARVLRQMVLALSPGSESLAIARRLGFEVLREEQIASLGLSVVRLRIPAGIGVAEALARLRAADPAGIYDFDHIYDPSGEGAASVAEPAPAATHPAAKIRIGMIDGGIDRDHRDFADAEITQRNFANRKDSVPTPHGTAVASLLIGEDIAGTLPRAELYAADVYGGEAAGGAADDIARALGWLVSNQVAVVNISLAGPPNAILQAAVKAFSRGGRVIVAAAGNDGPAAPVEYPAGYAGVVAVTSVDERFNIQLDANQGAYIAFAASGVDRRVAKSGGGHTTVTGTSYAAPQVAVRFAVLLRQADDASLRAARAALERDAHDLGVPGRDPVFGYGYLAPRGPGSGASVLRQSQRTQ